MKRKHVDAFNPKENSRKNGKNNDGKAVPTAQDLKQYLAKNNVEPLFVSIMECLCIDRPKNVPAYIIQYLQNNFSQDIEDVRSPKQSTPTTSMPESWSTFRFGSSNDMDETSDEIAAVNSYRMQKRGDNDDNEDPPVSDVVSENIRRRYSIGGRRVGLSNEPLDETLSSPVVVQKSVEDLKHIELALTQCTMLSHLDSDDKSTISSAMFPKHCEKDQLIIQQGDEGSHFYVIDSGECEVFVNGEFYKTLEKGESFGELALMHGTPRAATITAKTDVQLWAIDRVTFRQVLMGETIKKRKEYGGFLHNVEILKTLMDYEIQTVADALVQESWKDGKVIVQQNEPGHAFYIVVEGGVDVYKDNNLVAKLKKGDYFGEMALMFDQPRAATVKACGDVKTIRLDRQSFKRLLGTCEDVLKRNMTVYNQIISKQI